MAVLVLTLLLLVAMVSCDLQDMTWVMDENKISFFPGYDSPEYKFIYKIQHAGPYENVPFVAWNSYSTVEHMGTHMDAPYHFNQQGLTMDQVPLADLMGPLVRIDISERAATSPDAEVTISNLIEWETKHGEIPARSFVLMYSGWDKYYGDANYLGIKIKNDSTNHYPGFSGSAAEWLIDNRDIVGIGVDTVNCDTGKDHSFSAHISVLTHNKVCIENLKDIGKVPECGARFMMLPIMMKGGTGTQGRAFAEWYPGVGYKTDCNGSLKKFDSLFGTGKAHLLYPSMMLLVMATFYSLLWNNV